MPTYLYRCAKCGEDLEVWQSIKDDALTRHPGSCRGHLTKVLSPAGIVLKGSGFYRTDNRTTPSEKSSSDSSSSSDSGSKDSDSKDSDSKSSDSKPSDSKPSDSKSSDAESSDAKKSGAKSSN